MATRTPLIAGNWKMNLTHLEGIALVQKISFTLPEKYLKHVEVAVFPPFTALRSVQTLVDGDKLSVVYGAQDVSVHESGAYTGEISATMLKKLGCTYVIVGHSERRQYHGETDALIGEKARMALAKEMTPIICVGEGLDVRKAGEHVPYTLAQVEGCYEGMPADDAAKTVVAYEPVWAIGTGEVATPEDAQEVIGAIRLKLAELYGPEVADAIRILYGGSVKSSNVAAIMAKEDIDGALVGGASLKPEEFAAIARYQAH